MSTAIFPALPGLTFSVGRDQEWSTNVKESVSGLETAIAYWSYPRYSWSLEFEFLRSDSFAEFQTLFGFIEARQGRFDSFLYQDVEDNVVAAQSIGQGDGATTAFQLVRTFGNGTPCPVWAPNALTAVYLDGAVQAGGSYAVSAWTAPSVKGGLLTFNVAPANGKAIAADFSYYWPCRFLEDVTSFENFMLKLWATKKVTFRSIK